MKRHTIETILHEAVKVSRTEDIREQPLLDLVHSSLEFSEETGTLTAAEKDALAFIKRLKDPGFQKDLERAILIIDHVIKKERKA